MLRRIVACVGVLAGVFMSAAPAGAEEPLPSWQALFIDHFDGPVGTAPWDSWGPTAGTDPALSWQDGAGRLLVWPNAQLSAKFGQFLPGTRYRITARILMPETTYSHAAFWSRGGTASDVGEVDVIESYGPDRRTCQVQVAYYQRWDPDVGGRWCVRHSDPALPGITDPWLAWHDYAAEFTYGDRAAGTTFYVDGIPVWQVADAPADLSTQPMVFLQNKLNQPGSPDIPSQPPPGSAMQVDWVKVYALSTTAASPYARLVSADTTAGSTTGTFHFGVEVENAPLTTWSCAVDGVPLECPDPFAVTVRGVRLGRHTFTMQVQNPAGVYDLPPVIWFGGRPNPASLHW